MIVLFGNKDMGTQSGTYKARPIYGLVPRLSIFKHVDGYVLPIAPISLPLFTILFSHCLLSSPPNATLTHSDLTVEPPNGEA